MSKKITDLTELASIVESNVYWFEIVDMSEVNEDDRNKRVSEENLKAYFAGAETKENWTPVTTNITLDREDGFYLKKDSVVICQFDITFPVTADTNAASLNIPVNARNYDSPADFNLWYQGPIMRNNNSGSICIVDSNADRLYFYGTSGQLTNANMSGERVTGTITYIAE